MSNKQKPDVPGDFKAAVLSRRAERLARPAAEREEEERLFKIENAEAFASLNAWVEEHGLPLAKYRQF
jgi:antitoxin CcdA